MNIQIISNNTNISKLFDDDCFTISPFNAPISIEAYDLTIIDFQYSDIWVSKGTSLYPLNINKDLKTIKEIISNTKEALIIIALPLNYQYACHYISGRYTNRGRLKDRIDVVQTTVNSIITNYGSFTWFYEKNNTSLNGYDYCSEFSFDNDFSFYAVTKANHSNSLTSLCINERLYLTSLNIMESQEGLVNYLKAIGAFHESNTYPDWLNEIVFFNDIALKEQLNENNKTIEKLIETNSLIEADLGNNLKIKSILTATGDQLVDPVFKILEGIVDCDLSQFEDKKDEDFAIEKEDVIFVGEIKGISSNVKRTNLSQIELHCQKYLDEHDIDKPIKGILIINHQRNKPIASRESIHETQINLAKSYGVLIVESVTLLELYDRYLKKELQSSEIIELFKTEVGLLSI